MRYFMCSDKDDKLNVLSIYDSLEQALKRLKYHMKKEKCNLKIIPIPQISVGCKLYKKDGTLFGAIAYETNTLFGVSREDKKDAIPDPYGKQRIDRWIIDREFIVVDGNDFTEVEKAKDMAEHIDSSVHEILEKFDYLSSEQTTLL